ncbi:MAG: T9SS type A sorting domain-containing protein, partial [Bacteroidales bacterium]|nr:T9SS type A sorting domain-containing protein [Bacteroidales bacterium]
AKSTICRTQGSSSKGADNIFSANATNNLCNNGTVPVDYYYSTGSGHAPSNTTNVNAYGTATANLCGSTICGIHPDIPTPPPVPKSPTPGFLSLKEQYENLTEDFSRNGYADLLSATIPPQAGPPTLADELAAAQHAAQQINDIATELYAQSHAAVRALMSDTLEDVQAVHAWLDATPGLVSRYLAVEAGFVAGADAVEAHGRASLQDIATHLTTAAERDEYDNYVAFQALKDALSYGNGHVAWPRATDAQVGELVRIADANTGRSSLLAKNVLCFFFGICYDDDMETRALATTTIPPQAEPPALTGQQNVIVHPNPTDNVLHVSVTDGEIARIEMFDAFGRVIPVETHGRASLPSPTTTVNTSDIPSGVYVLRVTMTDGTVRTTKIVKR